MLLYIPIILIRRITTALMCSEGYIHNIVWNICYNKRKGIYAMSREDNRMLEVYIMTNLKLNVEITIDPHLWLYLNTFFMPYNDDDDIFVNNESILLKKIGDKVFKTTYDEEGNIHVEEEWILLADKTKQ